MPVFHTKTIESILEPVAEQVSQLVILHDKGEEGAAMPPLVQPIESVKSAVTNLATIGKGQVETTKDEVLKLDTPPAISKLEQAAELLVDAAKTLGADNLSKIGREKLITGARGILHGTSDLLLVFDAAEVRRICRVCQGVRDYLKVSEVVQQMDDLVTFVKNLTPGMTNMAKMVTQRSNDLTNSDHAQKLLAKVAALKVQLPNLISSMKVYVTIASENNESGLEASKKNKIFYVNALSDEITDIINLLQLVSTDTEMELEKFDMVELTSLKSDIIKGVHATKLWLQDPSDKNSEGQLALYKTVSDVKALGEEVQGSQGEILFKKCDIILKKAEQLQKLSKEGQIDSPEVIQLQHELQQYLDELVNDVDVSMKQLSKVNEARIVMMSNTPIIKEWLLDPSAKPNPSSAIALQHLTNATKVMVNELDQNQPSRKREELNQICDEIDAAMKKMIKFRENGHGHLLEARELGKHTADKIVQLNNAISATFSKPATLQTVESKMNDINRWLEDPDINDGGQGMIAASSMISTVYSLAGNVKQAELRSQMLQKAAVCDSLCKQLYELQRSGLGDSPQSYQTAEELKIKFAEIKEIVKDVLVESVSDEFSETSVILKQFKHAAMAATNVPNRDVDFEESALTLQKHAACLATLGQQAVGISQLGADEKLERVKSVSHKIVVLTPELINAGKVVHIFPENKQAQEHLQALSNEWTENVEELTEQVDDAMEVSKFIQASEEGIKMEIEKCTNAMHENEPIVALAAAGNIARRAHRILMAGKREVENTDEETYVSQVSEELDAISNSISPIVKATRAYVQNPSANETQKDVQLKNDDLIKAISKVRQTVEGKVIKEKMRSMQIAQQHVVGEESSTLQTIEVDGPESVDEEIAPPRPPLPKEEEPELPPRPPIPEEEEEEEEFPEEEEEDDHKMMIAARELHEETTKWEAKGNDIIGAAKQMALLMAKMSRLVRDEEGKKSDMISCAKEIAKGSSAITAMSKVIAEECTDKRIRNDMKRTLDKIPTISTQLRILSTVKAASLGDKEDMTKEEEDAAEQATEMLVLNAQNLMMSVKEAVRYAEAASIRIRTDTVGTVRWVRK